MLLLFFHYSTGCYNMLAVQYYFTTQIAESLRGDPSLGIQEMSQTENASVNKIMFP